jgi:hypothetical protein
LFAVLPSVLVYGCSLHYIEVSINGFLGVFLIVNVAFAGCNYGYSMSNRWNGNSYDDNDINCTQVTATKDVSSREISKDFTWLGSAWHCQQRLKHYKSFCRRGITISVCPLTVNFHDLSFIS